MVSVPALAVEFDTVHNIHRAVEVGSVDEIIARAANFARTLATRPAGDYALVIPSAGGERPGLASLGPASQAVEAASPEVEARVQPPVAPPSAGDVERADLAAAGVRAVGRRPHHA